MSKRSATPVPNYLAAFVPNFSALASHAAAFFT